jgi:hypothetical protein
MVDACVIPKRPALAAGLVDGRGDIRLTPDVDVAVVAEDALEGYSGGDDGIEGDRAVSSGRECTACDARFGFNSGMSFTPRSRSAGNGSNGRSTFSSLNGAKA